MSNSFACRETTIRILLGCSTQTHYPPSFPWFIDIVCTTYNGETLQSHHHYNQSISLYYYLAHTAFRTYDSKNNKWEWEHKTTNNICSAPLFPTFEKDIMQSCVVCAFRQNIQWQNWHCTTSQHSLIQLDRWYKRKHSVA